MFFLNVKGKIDCDAINCDAIIMDVRAVRAFGRHLPYGTTRVSDIITTDALMHCSHHHCYKSHIVIVGAVGSPNDHLFFLNSLLLRSLVLTALSSAVIIVSGSSRLILYNHTHAALARLLFALLQHFSSSPVTLVSAPTRASSCACCNQVTPSS